MAEEEISILAVLKDSVSQPMDKIKEKLSSLKEGFDKLKEGLEPLTGRIAEFAASIASLEGFNKAIEAAQEADDANRKFKLALNDRIDLYDEYKKKLEEVAKSAKIYREDEITALATQLRQGGIPEQELIKTVKTTLDYATATGKGLQTAGFEIERLYGGTIPRALRITMPELTLLNKAQLQAGEGIDIVAKKYDGYTEKYVKDNPFAQLKEDAVRQTEAYEKLGNQLVQIKANFLEGFTAALERLAQGLNTPAGRAFVEILENIAKKAAAVIPWLVAIITALTGLKLALAVIGPAFEAAFIVFGGPLTLAILGVGILATAFYSATDGANSFHSAVDNAIKSAGQLIRGFTSGDVSGGDWWQILLSGGLHQFSDDDASRDIQSKIANKNIAAQGATGASLSGKKAAEQLEQHKELLQAIGEMDERYREAKLGVDDKERKLQNQLDLQSNEDAYKKRLITLDEYLATKLRIERSANAGELEDLAAAIKYKEDQRASAVKAGLSPGDYDRSLIQLYDEQFQLKTKINEQVKKTIDLTDELYRKDLQQAFNTQTSATKYDVANGNISKGEGLSQNKAYLQSYLAALTDIEDKAQADFEDGIIPQSAFDKTFVEIEEMKEKANKGFDEVGKASLKIHDALQAPFEAFFDGVISGTENVGKAFQNLFKSILQDVEKYFSNQLAMGFINNVLGAGKSDGTGGLIGLLGQGAAFIGGLGFASGGYVPGMNRGDDRLIGVGGGEFVVNHAAVAHYGAGMFEQLNAMSVPRGFSGSFASSSTPNSSRMGYATGGPVSNYGTGGGIGAAVVVANDKQFEMQLRAGKRSMLQFMQENRDGIKSLLG